MLEMPSVASVGITSATTVEYGESRVRPSTARITSADTPTSSDARLISPGCRIRSSALPIALLPLTSAPVRSPSWPQMMLTATPVRKPIITEIDTNRV